MLLMNEFTHDARVTKEAITLIHAGHRVTVFALKSSETTEYETRSSFDIYRISLSLRYLLPKNQIFFLIKYLEYIIRAVNRLWALSFDAYHANDLETLPIAYILGKVKKRPVVYDSHELYIDMGKHHPLARKLWYVIEKFLSKRTTVNILTTRSRCRIFAERYLVKLPVTVMNCQNFVELKKYNLFRKSLPIPKNEKIIIYQGVIAPERGIDVLIEAFKKLDHGTLILMGSGSYKDKLKDDLNHWHQKRRIFILDPVPWAELYRFTASADIGISLVQNIGLNHYTMLSNKLFEYLTAGLPVIFPDFPEWRNIIYKNEIGIVVDETNPYEVANAIQRLIEDKRLYWSMSKNAIEIVKNKYNWQNEGRKLVHIYNKLTN